MCTNGMPACRAAAARWAGPIRLSANARAGSRSASSNVPTAAAFTIAHGACAAIARAIVSGAATSSSGRPSARTSTPSRTAVATRSCATRPRLPAIRIGRESGHFRVTRCQGLLRSRGVGRQSPPLRLLVALGVAVERPFEIRQRDHEASPAVHEAAFDARKAGRTPRRRGRARSTSRGAGSTACARPAKR